MSAVGNSPKPPGQQGKELADAAATKLQSGVQSAQQTAVTAGDKASAKVDEVTSNVAPMLDKVSDQAQRLVQQGREVFEDTAQRVREKAAQASDLAVGYAKDEPVKAMLMAAAAGAALMGLIMLMARSRKIGARQSAKA